MKICIYPKEELLARWRQENEWYKSRKGKLPHCLRCGGQMPDKLGRCALSRHIDVQICEKCGMAEAGLDWCGKPLPLRDWYAVKQGLEPANDAQNPVLSPVCGFSFVFEQDRRVVFGHPSGFPMSELCYTRADHDGYRWHNTWTKCRDMPDDTALIREIDEFYDALVELPEFKNLYTLRMLCKDYAKQVNPDIPEYNLYSETPHFYIWLRLITREKDYNLYCH